MPMSATKIVALTLFVDPGSRVYVRHINFTGTTRSNDETLRREMRQLEGAWLSNVASSVPSCACSACPSSRASI